MSTDPNQPTGFPPSSNDPQGSYEPMATPAYPPAAYPQPGPAYGQPVARDMSTTAMVLGICLLIFALLAIVGALFMGTLLTTILANAQAQNPGQPAMPAGFTTILSVIVGFFFGLLPLLAGVGLLMKASWGRILAIVAGVVILFSFPFGTILGICILIFLLRGGAADGYKLLGAPRRAY